MVPARRSDNGFEYDGETPEHAGAILHQSIP